MCYTHKVSDDDDNDDMMIMDLPLISKTAHLQSRYIFKPFIPNTH